MSVYRNLEKIHFQVVLDKKIDDDENLYSFYFKDTRSNFIGIPVPDFSPKIKETFTEKYLETLICSIFDEHAPHYFLNNQCYISLVLTKQKMNALSKKITEEYAKKVKNIIGYYDDVNFKVIKNEKRIFIQATDTKSLGLSFDKNARKNEYDFVMSCLGFNYYKNDLYVAEDWDADMDEVILEAKKLKFDLHILN